MHASPLKAMGTVFQTQSQGYENNTYQTHSKVMGDCFPYLPGHLGEEARLPPFTLHLE